MSAVMLVDSLPKFLPWIDKDYLISADLHLHKASKILQEIQVTDKSTVRVEIFVQS